MNTFRQQNLSFLSKQLESGQRSHPTLTPRSPLTPGQRHQVERKHVIDGVRWSPKRLTTGRKKTGGRNQKGKMTSFHRGGGASHRGRSLRPLWLGHHVLVLGTQRDPTRKAPVSLVLDLDLLKTGRTESLEDSERKSEWKGDLHSMEERGSHHRRSYVITGEGMKSGSVLQASQEEKTSQEASSQLHRELGVNTRCRRSWLPVGSKVYDRSGCDGNPRKSSRFKSCGAYGTILGHGFHRHLKDQVQWNEGSSVIGENRAIDSQETFTRIRHPSGEERRVPSSSGATLGQVSCADRHLGSVGKAGKTRNAGRRPTVRGSAMNPIDHPHGGRTKGGRHEVTPWAHLAKGRSTRPVRSSRVVKTSRQSRQKK